MNRVILGLSKGIALLVACTIPALSAGSTTWKADPVHSSANFTATHLAISHVKGIIPIKSASLVVPDGSNIPTSATASLDPSGIDTQNSHRDSDLTSAHFFDVADYPKMEFASTSVTAIDATHFTMVGNLTMHGQTHPVTLTGQYLARAPGMRQGETRIAYTATATIDRTQWGMTYFVPVASSAIDLEIDIEAASESP
jgi:polyisoprenoid-binding protein YceI